MGQHPVRRIEVDGRTMVWRHYRRDDLTAGVRVPQVHVALFEEGLPRSRLQIVFREAPPWRVVGLADGIVWREGGPGAYNLNRPAVIEALARHALTHGWRPAEDRRPMLIPDGLGILAAGEVPTGWE